MTRLLKLHLVSPIVFIVLFDVAIELSAIYAGLFSSYADVGNISRAVFQFAPATSLFVAACLLCKFAFGLHDWEARLSLSSLIGRSLVSFTCAFVLLSVIVYVAPGLGIWRSAMIVGLPLAFAGTISARYIYLRLPQAERMRRRVLVMGVGAQAARIESLELGGHASTFRCVAFMDLGGEETRVSRRRVIAKVNSLPDFIKQNLVDEIVVAIQERRGRLPVQSLIDCRLTGTPVREYQEFCERETGRIDLDALKPDWFIYSDGFPGGQLQHSAKRALDIVASIVLLALMLPLMLAVAIAVKLNDFGPVFYRQERLGFRGQSFTLIKFRSMSVEAERDAAPTWAAADDSRVTYVGRFLRNTRIDELPQLINILRGDMSFVGPRPERPYFVEQLAREIPFYCERLRVKPGLTGWAQLKYAYGASSEDAKQKLQYDLYYIKYFSVIRDIMIILQTARVVLWPHGVR